MEVYGLLASGGIYDWPVIKQISWILGQVMNGIYNVMSAIGIENIGVSIIIFTIIVYTILLPLTIKQQKFSKMTAVINPEIQKIQKKYAGKKDQVSQQKQMEETNQVYEKYGVKMSSGCLPSLMQLVILFGLYPVVQNIPEYVTKVRNVYQPLVDQIESVKGYQGIIESVAGSTAGLYDFSTSNGVIEALYKFQTSSWNALIEQMPSVENTARETIQEVGRLNNFLGIDIGSHPWNLLTDAIAAASIGGIILAVIIPILAGLTQFISVKLSQMTSTVSTQDSDPVLVAQKGHGQGNVGDVYPLAVGNPPAVDHLADQVFPVVLQKDQLNQAVVDENPVPRLDVPGQPFIGNGRHLIAAHHIPGGEGKHIPRQQLRLAALNEPQAHLRALGVQQRGHRDPQPFPHFHKLVKPRLVLRMGLMGEVEAGHIHPRMDELFQPAFHVRGRSESTDNFCLTHRRPSFLYLLHTF